MQVKRKYILTKWNRNIPLNNINHTFTYYKNIDTPELIGNKSIFPSHKKKIEENELKKKSEIQEIDTNNM